MSEKQVQMALDLRRKNCFSHEHFIYSASNKAASQWIKRKEWSDGRLWIWGASGCGKSHLLHVWASENNAFIGEASSLSRGADGEIFFNHLLLHDPMGNIALDHLENLKDEVALLHLLNRAYAERCKVLMVSRRPPSYLDIKLPDLASRLRATVSVQILEPEDRLRAALLISLLAEKQLVVPQSVIEFLWRHLPRTGEALVSAVNILDEVALRRGVPISRALAQEVLDL